jgi:hypothetical protein
MAARGDYRGTGAPLGDLIEGGWGGGDLDERAREGKNVKVNETQTETKPKTRERARGSRITCHVMISAGSNGINWIDPVATPRHATPRHETNNISFYSLLLITITTHLIPAFHPSTTSTSPINISIPSQRNVLQDHRWKGRQVQDLGRDKGVDDAILQGRSSGGWLSLHSIVCLPSTPNRR